MSMSGMKLGTSDIVLLGAQLQLTSCNDDPESLAVIITLIGFKDTRLSHSQPIPFPIHEILRFKMADAEQAFTRLTMGPAGDG